MDYFRTLNLQKEPFSNSPDPGFFFESRMHKGCLQRLELSIRLRRGLNVVLGEVGTGKTTLCRHLIRRLASDEKIETHLVLDPAFPDPLAFLQDLASMFGLPLESDAQNSEWRIKNEIQKHLFQAGFEEGRILALIIDEGQKISDSCLEILRELLNYEGNECKWLQIVIFAQTEFEQTLLKHPNFADRISLYTKLGPLPLRETKAMIEYRLNKASQGYPVPALFTPLGFLAIYRATRGYPRKIIHLCHRTLLAMVIQNRTRAGWSLVQWAASMAFPSRKPGNLRRLGLAMVFLVLGLAALLVERHAVRHWDFGFVEDTHKPSDARESTGREVSRRSEIEGARGEEKPAVIGPTPVDGQFPKPVKHLDPKTSGAQSSPSALIENPSGPPATPGIRSEGSQPEPALSGAGRGTESNGAPATGSQQWAGDAGAMIQPPKELGQIAIAKGETLRELIQNVYGSFTPARLQAVKKLNPHVRNVRVIETGTAIRFPALEPLGLQTAQPHWVALAVSNSLTDCYELLRKLHSGRTPESMRAILEALLQSDENDLVPVPPPGHSSPLGIVPFWNRKDGLKFAIVLKLAFHDRQSALWAVGALPPDWARQACVLGDWSEDSVFFMEDLPSGGNTW